MQQQGRRLSAIQCKRRKRIIADDGPRRSNRIFHCSALFCIGFLVGRTPWNWSIWRSIFTTSLHSTSSTQQFANVQWGFQNGKSTVTALLTTTNNYWFRMLDSGKDVCAVFFDISTEGIWSDPYHALLQRLWQTGLNNHILHWVCSYLTNRKQQVLVNGATSESLPIISGVPQGSVLGATFVFIFIIDGVMSAPLCILMMCYCTDTLKHHRTIKALEWQTPSWNGYLLRFSVSKCKSVLTSRKRNPLQHPVLSLCGQVLEQVECFKY